MSSKSISSLNLLQIFDEHSRKKHYGCDQEWYAYEWQRLSGCGPTAVCNIIYYLNKTRPAFGIKQSCDTKETSMSFMEEIWDYVTPTIKGIPTTKMFYEAVLAYTKSKGLNVEYSFCDVPEDKSIRPKLADLVIFIEGALSKDVPVAFLNLCNGDEHNLEPWHWVTIISLDYTEDENSVFVNIVDGGLIKKIDLSLWYNTTTLGGGFVYFTTVTDNKNKGVYSVDQDFMEVTYDKFVFRVKKGYLYHPGECWAKEEDGIVTIGLTDFLQKTAGDVAFIEAPEAGAEVSQGGDAGVIETIKTTVTLVSPASGVILEINAALEDSPQLINTDPYGEGWVFRLKPADWEQDKKALMNDEAYFPMMEEKIKKEMEKKSS